MNELVLRSDLSDDDMRSSTSAATEVLWGWKRDRGTLSRTVFFEGRMRFDQRALVGVDMHFFFRSRLPPEQASFVSEPLRDAIDALRSHGFDAHLDAVCSGYVVQQPSGITGTPMLIVEIAAAMETPFERRVKATEVDFNNHEGTGGLQRDIPGEQRSAHQSVRKPPKQGVHECIRRFALSAYAAVVIAAEGKILNDVFLEAVYTIFGRDRDTFLTNPFFV